MTHLGTISSATYFGDDGYDNPNRRSLVGEEDDDGDDGDDGDDDSSSAKICAQACFPMAIFVTATHDSWQFGTCKRRGYKCSESRGEQEFADEFVATVSFYEVC